MITRTVAELVSDVGINLNDAGHVWVTTDDIKNAIQDQYNLLALTLGIIDGITEINKLNTPYYNMSTLLTDFINITGIYNPTLKIWLEGTRYLPRLHGYKIPEGQPRFFEVLDLRRAMLWPYVNIGTLLVLYKRTAPTITDEHVPLLPYSVGTQILEYASTADLLEQHREFKKAKIWWDKIYSTPIGGRSLYMQAEQEIKTMAKADLEMILQPYSHLFHGGVI